MNRPSGFSRWTLRLALVSLGFLATHGAYSQELQWQLASEENQISVYTREIPGSPYIAVKVTALIDAPVAQVSKYLGDGNGCAEWRDTCKSSEILDILSDRERYVYLVLDLPWPVSDRDLVMHTTAELDTEAATATVNMRTESSMHPDQGFVRVESSGRFLIKAISEQKVEFTYEMHTDLGGDLSADLINPRLADSALKDVSRLKALAES